eukprot:s2852_g10.t1
MPGPWINLAENHEFFQELQLKKGDLLEAHLYDDTGSPQGFGLWDVREQVEKKKEGLWARCRLVAVSDSHLKWWLTDGAGKDNARRFLLHLCCGPAPRCRKKKVEAALEFHTDYFRFVDAGTVTGLKVAWFKEGPAKDDLEAEVSRLAGQSPPRGGAGAGQRHGPLGFSESEPGPDIPPGAAPPEGEDLQGRLKELRRDVAKPQEKKPKKAKDRRKGKTSEEKRKPAAAADQPLWFGKRKAAIEPRSDESSSSSDSSGRPARGSKEKDRRSRSSEKKKKKQKKKQDKTKKHKSSRRVGDRGPFGTGAKVMFAKDNVATISSDDDSSGSDVFQAAPSGKSKQLQLMEYAQKNPGRLASRLLTKMRTLLAREEGAMKDQSGQSNLTPATATSYFLTVLLPLHRDRLHLRVQRELRTVAKALDLIAMGAQEEAADVL